MGCPSVQVRRRIARLVYNKLLAASHQVVVSKNLNKKTAKGRKEMYNNIIME